MLYHFSYIKNGNKRIYYMMHVGQLLFYNIIVIYAFFDRYDHYTTNNTTQVIITYSNKLKAPTAQAMVEGNGAKVEANVSCLLP